MAIVKNVSRQWMLVAEATVGYAELEDAVQVPVFDVPVGARVAGGYVIVNEVWDSGTSDDMDVGDGDDDDRYSPTILPLDGTAADYVALIATGYKYTTDDTIDLLWQGVGSVPTQGELYVEVWYTVEGRGNEIQT